MKTHKFLLGIFLVSHGCLLGWSSYIHSPVTDEVPHLVAGLSYYQLGSFELYSVNPPLVRLLATLPVLFQNPVTNWKNVNYAPGVRSESPIANDFIKANGSRTMWYIILARWACIPLALLAGYVCYRWALELFGMPSGFVALTLWSFSPTVLGWGATITSDVGAAALGVLASYRFWRWLKNPAWSSAYFAGITLGLSELTKSTWIFLYVLWPAISLFRIVTMHGPFRYRLQLSLQILLILFLGITVLNLAYGFEGSFLPLGEYEFVSRALAGNSVPFEIGNNFTDTWLGSIPVPFPRPYVLGIDLQRKDFEVGMVAFLRGEFREGGWWYYYLYAFMIKTPIGTLILMLIAIMVTFADKRYSSGTLAESTLLLPGLLLFILVSSQGGINSYFRYVLPSFPFFFIWASKIAVSARLRHWPVVGISVIAIVWSVTSSLFIYPHEISFFNELAGGPENGYAHLLDSNIDAGQDLLFLKRWVDKNPQAKPLYIDVQGGDGPEFLGIVNDGSAEKTRLAPGWHAVSIHRLCGMQCEYAHLQQLTPFAKIGYSIYIYQILH